MYSNSVIQSEGGKAPHFNFAKFDEQICDQVSGLSLGLEVELQEPQRFLELLDPLAESFTFQTFDDKKDKRPGLVRQLHSEFSSAAGELIELNQAGAGIYVTVQRTDLQGRKAENILGVRSLYADFDDGLPDELPLEPSMVVETSPGKFQCYWLCQELNGQDFKCLMERLVEDFGADKGAKDIARVLRVPGFYHNKMEPFLVQIVSGVKASYTRQAILDAFLPKDDQQPEEAPGTGDQIAEALSYIPADDYSVWRDVGFALHHEYSGATDGYTIWENWSATAPHKFSKTACKEKWASFDSRCKNPLTLGTLFHYARENGWKGSTRKFVWPETSAGGAPIKRSQWNISAALEHLGTHLFYDEFAFRYYVKGLCVLPQEMDDRAVRALWLKVDALGLKCSKDYFYDVVCYLAEQDMRHPIRTYLDGLVWDGKSRLNGLLPQYCGAEDTEFNQIVGRKWMVASVHRARKPGVKFDNLLVLEGEQGVGKSSFPRILASDEWFSDCIRLGDDSKTIAEQTGGKWIVELPELVGLRKREVETVKSMLSRQFDIARMAYHRSTSNFPRQFIFIGTTNADEYLIDNTGNRRFWSVKVQQIDLEALARDRDQLWAEAAYYEAQGESIVLPQELWKEAETVQAARKLVDPQEDHLRELVSELRGVVPQDELFAALGVGGERVSSRSYRHKDIVKRVMDDLGWVKTRRRKPESAGINKVNSDNRMIVYESNGRDPASEESWWRYNADEGRFFPDHSIQSVDA